MRRNIAFMLVLSLVFSLVAGVTAGTAVAVEPPAPVLIADTAGLVAAIAGQAADPTPGQTWILAPGTYDLPRFTDAQVPKVETGGQDLWYFPIILDGLTITGDGTGEVVLTSTVQSANGAWASQDFISVWANGVTIEGVTLHAKQDTNKAIEVMGKDFTLRDTMVLTNPNGPWAGYDFEKFSGSVYFSPQASITGTAGDVGNSRLENVFIEGGWLSVPVASVTLGEVALSGVTIDWVEAAYAPVGPDNWGPYGMMSPNTRIVVENDVTFIVDETIYDLVYSAIDRMPDGATLELYGEASPATELPAEAFTHLMTGGVYPANGELYFSYADADTGFTPYEWMFPVETLDPSFDATFYPAVGVRTTADTAVEDMVAADELPASGLEVAELDFAHSGSLPGPASVSVYVTDEFAGLEFGLYEYGIADAAAGADVAAAAGALVDAGQSVVVDEDGYVTIDIETGDFWYLIQTEAWPSGRVSGPNRYSTGTAISTEHFESADTAVVATGRDFADGLAASGLAGAYDAPVLLTDSATLSPGVAAELQRLGVSRVIVCGGTKAITDGVKNAIDSLPGVSVERIGGTNRYETARLLANKIVEVTGVTPSTVFVARGDQFPDALAVSPIAWANDLPVLLTPPAALSSAAAAYLTAEEPELALIVGGTSAVSTAAETTLKGLVGTVERQKGDNRYETAVAVGEWAYGEGLADTWFVGIATGADFPDALAAGAGVGARNGVLLLTQKATVSGATAGFVELHEADIETLQVFGGTAVVDDDVLDELMMLAGLAF